jgi:hypothetical protein
MAGRKLDLAAARLSESDKRITGMPRRYRHEQ